MNLHGIVSGVISSVNPFVTAQIQRSNGYTTSDSGEQIPDYIISDVSVQVQPLGYNDIQQVSGLNIQGTKRKVYLNGNWDGLVRAREKGGDIITLPNGDIYLVVMVLEMWPDWCCLACVLQDAN